MDIIELKLKINETEYSFSNTDTDVYDLKIVNEVTNGKRNIDLRVNPDAYGGIFTRKINSLSVVSFVIAGKELIGATENVEVATFTRVSGITGKAEIRVDVILLEEV